MKFKKLRENQRSAYKLFSAQSERPEREGRDGLTGEKLKQSFHWIALVKRPRAKVRLFQLARQKQNKTKRLLVLSISNSLAARKGIFNLRLPQEVALS